MLDFRVKHFAPDHRQRRIPALDGGRDIFDSVMVFVFTRTLNGYKGILRLHRLERRRGMIIGSIQKHDIKHTFWIQRCEMAEFDPRQRVPGQNGPIDLQAIHELPNVFRQRLDVVAGFRIIGLAVSAPGQCQNVELIDKARSEAIEDVGRAAQSRQKQKRRPVAAPIQIMQAGASLTFTKSLICGDVSIVGLLSG